MFCIKSIGRTGHVGVCKEKVEVEDDDAGKSTKPIQARSREKLCGWNWVPEELRPRNLGHQCISQSAQDLQR